MTTSAASRGKSAIEGIEATGEILRPHPIARDTKDLGKATRDLDLEAARDQARRENW